MNMPPGGANDSGEQDDDSDWDMDDPNLEPPPSGHSVDASVDAISCNSDSTATKVF